jgi:hypothetical protein
MLDGRRLKYVRGEPPVKTPEWIDDDIRRHHLEGISIKKIARTNYACFRRVVDVLKANHEGRRRRGIPAIVESVVSLLLSDESISSPQLSQNWVVAQWAGNHPCASWPRVRFATRKVSSRPNSGNAYALG